MNREILFRGKCFDTKEWIYGSLLEDDIIVTKGSTDVDEDYIGFSGEWSSVLPETVGQFTGLTDLCGTKVFENDIIKYSGTGAEVYGVIRYGSIPCDSGREENTGFYIEWQDLGANEWNEWYRHDLKFWINEVSTKIVGNIFDNPELLPELLEDGK